MFRTRKFFNLVEICRDEAHIIMFIISGMIVRDYCGNGMRAVAMAEEMFPQFGSSEAQCTKDPNKLMLGKSS